MTEAEFQKSVIELAHLNDWKVAHFPKAHIQRKDGSGYYATSVTADGKGFPDLVISRPPRLVFAEIKAERGILSYEQMQWLDWLQSSKVEAHPFWPKDWDHIVAILGGKEWKNYL